VRGAEGALADLGKVGSTGCEEEILHYHCISDGVEKGWDTLGFQWASMRKIGIGELDGPRVCSGLGYTRWNLGWVSITSGCEREDYFYCLSLVHVHVCNTCI
jgi:hypothetical protein